MVKWAKLSLLQFICTGKDHMQGTDSRLVPVVLYQNEIIYDHPQ